MLWLFYDPFTLIALILAYIVGFTTLVIAAGHFAPRVARKVAGRFTLQSSMLLMGSLVLLSGLAGVGLIAYLLAGIFEAEITIGVIASIITLIVILNAISYFMAPLTINLIYGARHSSELQQLVNSVATRLGIAKPPKAVIVRGPPNAFAYGNLVFGKYVAVSSSLVNITTQDELKAIIGHELGHHKHRDNAIMLFIGLIPSILYFMGIFLIRAGMITGYARSYYARDSNRRGGGGLALVLAGFAAVAFSFIVQILVLAFSRLREYYADSTGAYAAGKVPMQRALARIHVYYTINSSAKEMIAESKLKALFIYALTASLANPFYHHIPPQRDVKSIDIDKVVEELKSAPTDISEFLSTHPPIPKRLRFLDTITSI